MTPLLHLRKFTKPLSTPLLYLVTTTKYLVKTTKHLRALLLYLVKFTKRLSTLLLHLVKINKRLVTPLLYLRKVTNHLVIATKTLVTPLWIWCLFLPVPFTSCPVYFTRTTEADAGVRYNVCTSRSLRECNAAGMGRFGIAVDFFWEIRANDRPRFFWFI